MDEKFTCSICKGVFNKEWSDDEALAELKDFFGEISTANCALVCDDCWEEVRPDKHGFTLPVRENDFPGQSN